MVWPAIIGAAAAIGGGILGNKAQAGQAQDNRDFQADQYSRRYQITMADMKAAGLNPMLAYSQGVGSSPAGSMGNMGDFGGGEAGSIIAQAGMRKSAAKQADTASTQNISTAKNLDQDTKLKKTQERETQAKISKIKGETAATFQQAMLYGSQTELTNEQVKEVKSKINQLASQTGLTKAQKSQLEQEIAKFAKHGSGLYGDNFDSFVKSLKTVHGWDVAATAYSLNKAKQLWQLLKDGNANPYKTKGN